jgi:hypothetical protein
MTTASGSPRTRPIYLWFGFLTVLVYFLSPEYLLDIPTTYMLRNHLSLHEIPPQ